MNIIDLEGKDHRLTLSANAGDRPRSDLHIQARALIKEVYPLTLLCEEVTVPVRKGSVIYLDFFIPQNRICIEVHGRQHFEFVAHFHGNLLGFRQHQKRDREKKQLLELNNIRLIEFNYNEDINQWKTKLLNL